MRRCLSKWWFLGGLVAACTVGFSPEAGASPPGEEATSVLDIAKVGLGPLPGAAVMEPIEIEEIDDVIARYAWPMPQVREWPIDIGGRPIVETRRSDELWHTIEGWMSLGRLHTMYRRSYAQLREWNPEIDFSELEEGERILVWQREDGEISESIGDPDSGRLLHGEPMPQSDDYIVLYPHRTFGTYYAISETVRVLDAYYEEFPDADPLIVGDASFRTGRAMGPHSSHQSGRDIDVTLPRLREPPDYEEFHHVRRDNLDASKALWFLTELIEGGYVESVFLDRHHQRTLWRLAREQGAPEEWLEAVFQYPRHRRVGLVRHEPGHRTHFHIRFACQETDRWCH